MHKNGALILKQAEEALADTSHFQSLKNSTRGLFVCYDGCMRKTARALIIKNGKILLVSGYGASFYWTPGGGIESGETPITALARELKEELSLEACKYNKFTNYIVGDQDVTNYLVMTSEKIQPSNEIEKIAWVSKKDIENGTIKVSKGFKTNAFVTLVENRLL